VAGTSDRPRARPPFGGPHLTGTPTLRAGIVDAWAASRAPSAPGRRRTRQRLAAHRPRLRAALAAPFARGCSRGGRSTRNGSWTTLRSVARPAREDREPRSTSGCSSGPLRPDARRGRGPRCHALDASAAFVGRGAPAGRTRTGCELALVTGGRARTPLRGRRRSTRVAVGATLNELARPRPGRGRDRPGAAAGGTRLLHVRRARAAPARPSGAAALLGLGGLRFPAPEDAGCLGRRRRTRARDPQRSGGGRSSWRSTGAAAARRPWRRARRAPAGSTTPVAPTGAHNWRSAAPRGGNVAAPEARGERGATVATSGSAVGGRVGPGRIAAAHVEHRGDLADVDRDVSRASARPAARRTPSPATARPRTRTPVHGHERLLGSSRGPRSPTAGPRAASTTVPVEDVGREHQDHLARHGGPARSLASSGAPPWIQTMDDFGMAAKWLS
jgi:hypothetical protein